MSSKETCLVQFMVEFFKPGNEILCGKGRYPFYNDVSLLSFSDHDLDEEHIKLKEQSDSPCQDIFEVIKSFEILNPISYIGELSVCGCGMKMEVENTTVGEVFGEWVKDIINNTDRINISTCAKILL